MSDNRLQDLLRLCYVPRWVISKMNRPQSVAEHSYRVAVIVMELAGAFLDTPTASVAIVWALLHDGPESCSGDIPGPFKTSIGKPLIQFAEEKACPWFVPILDERISLIVHIADKIESVLWCRDHFVDERPHVEGIILEKYLVEADALFGAEFRAAVIDLLIPYP